MFDLNINTANAAFTEDENGVGAGYEVARILRELAEKIEYQSSGKGSVQDYNGNTVGKWELHA